MYALHRNLHSFSLALKNRVSLTVAGLIIHSANGPCLYGNHCKVLNDSVRKNQFQILMQVTNRITIEH
jgi:hypothetical protein